MNEFSYLKTTDRKIYPKGILVTLKWDKEKTQKGITKHVCVFSFDMLSNKARLSKSCFEFDEKNPTM